MTVTNAGDGSVRLVEVAEPFAGTAVGKCLAAAFESAKVPRFDGSDFVARKTFNLGPE